MDGGEGVFEGVFEGGEGAGGAFADVGLIRVLAADRERDFGFEAVECECRLSLQSGNCPCGTAGPSHFPSIKNTS